MPLIWYLKFYCVPPKLWFIAFGEDQSRNGSCPSFKPLVPNWRRLYLYSSKNAPFDWFFLRQAELESKFTKSLKDGNEHEAFPISHSWEITLIYLANHFFCFQGDLVQLKELPVQGTFELKNKAMDILVLVNFLRFIQLNYGFREEIRVK